MKESPPGQLELSLPPAEPLQATLDGLRRLLPGAFVEGRLDRERLLSLTGLGEREPESGRYRFTWAGREEAASSLRRASRSALAPDRGESLHFDQAENAIVEGDNLEVLKLLVPAYAGRVKLVVIDPPYNTGHDFLYPDDFSDGLGRYLEMTGQVDGAGNRLSSRADLDGRHHSRWLTMMYPRLLLARELLREDGAIFVLCDHGEVHHLRLLLDEVFGEENLVAHIAWQKRYTVSNNTDRFSSVLDHVLLYRRSEAFEPNLLPRPDDERGEFRNPDDDPRGPWKPTSFLNQVPPRKRPNLAYPIENPLTGEVTVPEWKAWRVNREGFERLLADGRLWWGSDGRRPVPHVKTFLSEIRKGLTPTNFWSHSFAGHNDVAQSELKDLFGGKVFDTPKPVLLVRRMLQHATGPEDLVLDFFAGSGTTADAVIQENAADGGRRRFLLVQLPEPISGGRYPTISAICRERVRRAAAAIPGTDPAGRGFRAFRLVPSALPTWSPDEAPRDPEALADALDEHARGAAGGAPEEDLFFEVLLRAGLPLGAAVEAVEIGGRACLEAGRGELLACLSAGAGASVDDELDDELIRALANRRARVTVLRESAFAGDDALRLRAARAFRAAGGELRTV